MNIYLPTTVLQEAQKRIARVFDEFENLVVSFSGGKDSTVVLNLALQEAERRGRLPLPVMFIDQEAEWQAVIDYIRQVMADPRVKPLWFQMPIRIFNATSTTEQWLECWKPGEEWMREKEPGSIQENVYGTDRFKDLFPAIMKHLFNGQPACSLSGVRAEESPNRRQGLTAYRCYKEITWGNKEAQKDYIYSFYPLYDWSYTDIWKAIHEHGWPYCKVYDWQYQYGVAVPNMRVSNLHHETAVKNLFYLQEVEPDTWNKLTRRLSGVNMAGQMKQDAFDCPAECPEMFPGGWPEYRDYLNENLVADETARQAFAKKFRQMDAFYEGMMHKEDMYRIQIRSILLNDYHLTKIGNWETGNPEVRAWVRAYKLGHERNPNFQHNKYLDGKRPAKKNPGSGRRRAG